MDLDLQAWERRAEAALGGGGGSNSGGDSSGGGIASGVRGGHFRSAIDSVLRRAEEEAGRTEARGRALGEAAEAHAAKATELLGQVEGVR